MALLRRLTCVLALLVLSLPVRADDDDKAKETPEEAFNAFKEAAKKKDGDAAWAFFSKDSQKKIVEQMAPVLEMVKGSEEAMSKLETELGKTEEEIKKMSDAELAKAMMLQGMKDGTGGIQDVKWVGVKVDGKKAICETQEKDKKKEQIAMVLEGGHWRLDLEATEKMKKEAGEGEGDEEDEGDEEKGEGSK